MSLTSYNTVYPINPHELKAIEFEDVLYTKITEKIKKN